MELRLGGWGGDALAETGGALAGVGGAWTTGRWSLCLVKWSRTCHCL